MQNLSRGLRRCTIRMSQCFVWKVKDRRSNLVTSPPRCECRPVWWLCRVVFQKNHADMDVYLYTFYMCNAYSLFISSTCWDLNMSRIQMASYVIHACIQHAQISQAAVDRMELGSRVLYMRSGKLWCVRRMWKDSALAWKELWSEQYRIVFCLIAWFNLHTHQSDLNIQNFESTMLHFRLASSGIWLVRRCTRHLNQIGSLSLASGWCQAKKHMCLGCKEKLHATCGSGVACGLICCRIWSSFSRCDAAAAEVPKHDLRQQVWYSGSAGRRLMWVHGINVNGQVLLADSALTLSVLTMTVKGRDCIFRPLICHIFIHLLSRVCASR